MPPYEDDAKCARSEYDGYQLEGEGPDGEAKAVVSETIAKLNRFREHAQAQADKHRKLAAFYQEEHDTVHNFLVENYFDRPKTAQPTRSF